MERDRIARELHDTLLQGVHVLILRFQLVADSSALVLRTMMRYALERESYRGSASAIFIELPKRNVGFRALPRVRSVTAQRLSVDQSLQGDWIERATKPQQ
jgi:Histidine kinase